VQQKQLTKPQINPLKPHLHAEHEISQLSDFSSRSPRHEFKEQSKNCLSIQSREISALR